jgi:hypothetical protein
VRALELIRPDWPAPRRVRAAMSTRRGGVSEPPFGSFNLGLHVGDDPAAVAANRAALREAVELPAEPAWLAQVHGVGVVDAANVTVPVEADASYATRAGAVCAILVADCLPVLLCDRAGTAVAAVHAGWRGLAGGVIESAVRALDIPGRELIAWLGPAIGPKRFEVGEEVRAAFMAHDPGAGTAFVAASPGKWLCDIYALARQRLAALGVASVHGGGACTVGDSGRFYSYRRDGRTGRMAALAWLEEKR